MGKEIVGTKGGSELCGRSTPTMVYPTSIYQASPPPPLTCNTMSSPKSILLTGASRGIGLAIANYLLKEKHNVFLVARTAAPMEELKKSYPGQVEFLAADLKDFEVRSVFFKLVLRCWGV